MLMFGLITFSIINSGNFNEKKTSLKNATVNIMIDDADESFDLEYLKSFTAETFIVDHDKNGKDENHQTVTGVLLKDIFDNKGIVLNGSETISFYALDGYITTCYGSEVLQNDNIYIIYMRDGKLIESKQGGGTGPFELVIRNDVFSQRWCKYLIGIEIE